MPRRVLSAVADHLADESHITRRRTLQPYLSRICSRCTSYGGQSLPAIASGSLCGHRMFRIPEPYDPCFDVALRYPGEVLSAKGSDPFAAYMAYREELSAVLHGMAVGASPESLGAEAHLDGLAYQRFRQSVPIATRRAFSTYFTSSVLRSRLVRPYRDLIARGANVLDPACGIGDLLISAIKLLPSTWSAPQLRHHVATCFVGRESLEILAAIAEDRLRLIINLLVGSQQRGADRLPLIQAGDGLAASVPYETADLILLNPPFGRKALSQRTAWAEGHVSEAAPFTLKVLERCRPGTDVAVILPDVLRSGSRYAKWRQRVQELADINRVEVVGAFDAWTSVDVFIAHLRVRDKVNSCRPTSSMVWYENLPSVQAGVRLADLASVSIGDVVPHRHAEEGPMVPYLTVHSTPIGVIVTTTPKRKFAGRLHQAPFIVVRRTSAPTRMGGSRLMPSIIHTRLGTVAVENHLIVIKPFAPGIKECVRVMETLTNPSVTRWLDARLRTRHLTKQALLELPIPNAD
jgi:hypothetical protein